MTLGVIDWIICALVLFSVITAAMQGFFSEALTTAGLIIGYIAAAWQYHHLAEWLESFLKNPWLAEILGFLIIFFAIVLLFGLAARVARWIMKEAGLSSFDRFLGAVLGLVRGGLMVAVILMGMTAFEPASKLLQNSQLAPYFLVLFLLMRLGAQLVRRHSGSPLAAAVFSAILMTGFCLVIFPVS